jgi:predicted lactoylglutathione lyase
MDQRISLITLGYRDRQRAGEFYTALGWTDAVAPDDEVVFFQASGMIVALWDRDLLAADSGVTPEEVDEILDRARAAGGTVPRAGGKREWGGYSGIFVDPEGHPWEVAHNPSWVLHDDGSVTLS